MIYFGSPWDVPMLNGAERIRVPVGLSCSWCGVWIQPGDLGFMMPVVCEYGISKSYVHRECYFVDTLGHLIGICGCFGYSATREVAILAWTRFAAMQADPPW